MLRSLATSLVLAAGLLVAAIGVSRSAVAQQPAAAVGADVPDRVQRAIADYEALKGQPKERARQRQALLWLGEIDEPAVTEYLQQELAATGEGGAAVFVLEAIAQRPRPQLQQELWNVLHSASASVALRVAAAKAIGSFGERGLDRLIEIVGAAEDATTPKARDAALVALIDSGSDRALRTLAPLLLDGPLDRLKLLRRLENVHGVIPISAARIRLVSEATLDVAALAWRQLAVEGHARARSLAIDMLERLVDKPRPAVAADLIGAIVLVRDADLYPLLLRFGSIPGDVVRNALRAAAPAVAQDRALVDYLIRKGLDGEQPATREVAKLLLAEAPAAAVEPLLTKVRAELRTGNKKSLELAVALHPLLARDPGWRADLLNLANSPETAVKVIGLSLMLDIGADTAIVAAQKCLAHHAWELRSVAYRYLTKCRDTSSIPLLIARVEREEGRLAHELSAALFAHTGTRCWRRTEWDAWWDVHRTGFAMPHPDTVKAGIDAGAGVTISYHGIPLVSQRVAFLVDVSGSMQEKIGTDKKRSRLDEAKKQLRTVLEAVSADHHVNLVCYESAVHPVWERLREATDGNRKEILDVVKLLQPTGGTNIFDALERAFLDPEIDTIYLLTDGTPTAGRLVDPDDILDQVQRWNRERQIVIHCISIGADSDLCKRLAADSGGVYKYVR